jgi:ribosomal-protein-alanine N-acetyltransferase
MAIVIDPISIESMRPEDIPSVMNIEKRCYTSPWHKNAYQTEISNPSATYIIARKHDRIIGYAGMWVIMDEAHITTIAVEPDFRRKHIGERLFAALIEEALFRGANRASLEVREHNKSAQNLYVKYGFREAALRKAYYTDNYENAIVMWVDNMRSAKYREKLDELKRALYDGIQSTGN